MKTSFTSLTTLMIILLSFLCKESSATSTRGLIISELLVNPAGTDSPFEYLELRATKYINFSITPYSVVVCNNGTATTNGWIAGGLLTYGFNINTGIVNPGDIVYVGGSSMVPTGTKLRVINTGTTAGDGFGSAVSGGVFGNGGTNADGVGVFDVAVTSITNSTVPIDAVFYGTGMGTAVVSAGTAGYQLPVNDNYSGGKLQTGSFLAIDPGASNLVATGVYDTILNSYTTPRTWAAGSLTDGTSSVLLGPLPDTTPPNLTSAKALNFNQIIAVYNEKVSNISATNLSNYSAVPSISISTIALSASKDTAFISLSAPLLNGTTYTLTATSIADTSGNIMASPQNTSFFFEKIIVNNYEWKTPPSIGTYQGIDLKNGGFSGLQYINGTDKEFYVITDRGPNVDANTNNHAIALGGVNNSAKLFPLPNFHPQIIRVKASGDSLIYISSTPLKKPDNSFTLGLINPSSVGGTGELAFSDTSGTQTTPDVWGIDSEGLTAGNDNDFWIPEEYGVSLWHTDINGKVINRYAPYGGTPFAQPQDIGIDTIFKYRNPNKGFEGVVFSPNGKVYAFIQNTILFPVSDGNLKKNTRLHRFVEIDPTTNVTRMLGYEHDKVNTTGPLSSIKNDKRYIGDAVAINDHEFLVLEHGKSTTEHYAKVYKIDITNASAINPTDHLIYAGGTKSFEQLLDSTTCASNGLTVVKKTLFIDLIANGYDFDLDKEEGLSILNDSTIAIANDNDFGIVSTNTDGVVSLTGSKSYIYTFSVPQYKKLNLCLPVTIAATSSTSFCQGDSVVLNAPAVGAATYSWKLNGNSISGANTNTYKANVSGNYSLTVINGSGCIANSNIKNIIVNPVPSAIVSSSGATTFCQGDSVAFSIVSGNIYQWNLNGTPIFGATSNNLNVNTSGNYSVVVTDVNNCSNTSSAQPVIVNPLPDNSVSASGSTNFCEGDSVTLSAVSGTAYQWKVNGAVITGATANFYNANTSGNYSVVITDGNSCINTSSIQLVNVNLLPDNTVTLSGSTTFCQGSSVDLNAENGLGYQWKLNGSIITGAIFNVYNASAPGNYSVVVTDANNCSNTSSVQTVNVNSLPDNTVTTSGATTFCDGDSVRLNAANGLSYQWTLDGASIQGETSNSYIAKYAGNYSVIITDGNNCSNTSSMQTVNVNSLPDNTVTTSGATIFCDGDSVVLNAASGLTYQWMLNGNNVINATSETYSASTSGNYSVFVSNANCSNSSSNINVVNNALPTIPMITQSGSILTSSQGANYQWYLNGSLIVGATSQNYTVVQDGNYSVIITNLSGCKAESAVMSINTTGIAATYTNGGIVIAPNPYAESTLIKLSLSENSDVAIEVYSVLGERVQLITNTNYAPGNYSFNFGARKLGYSSGIYLVKTTINHITSVTRIVEND